MPEVVNEVKEFSPFCSQLTTWRKYSGNKFIFNDCKEISIAILSHTVKLKSGLYTVCIDNNRHNFHFKLNQLITINNWAQKESQKTAGYQHFWVQSPSESRRK